MNANTLVKLQDAVKDASHGWQMDFEGKSFTTKFYANVNRSRDRFLLFCDRKKIGHMDSVVPYNIFKEPYEVFCLNFTTINPSEYLDSLWEEDPYQDENQPARFFSYHVDAEKMAKFAIKHFKELLEE
jgi:hypothetical protein